MKIDAVAFMRKKRSVPEATVGFVITNSKRLSNLQSIGWNFSSKVVAGIQKRGILEMNGHWVALQDLSCFFGPPRAFLFNNNLVDTRSIERKEEKKNVWVIVTLGQSILSETLMSHCRYVWKKNHTTATSL